LVAGQVLAKNEPVLLTDVAQSEDFDPELDQHVDRPAQSLLCIPMVGAGHDGADSEDEEDEPPLGVIMIVNKKPGVSIGGEMAVEEDTSMRAFDRADVELMMAFSAIATAAVKNAKMYQELMRQNMAFESMTEAMPHHILMLSSEGMLTGHNNSLLYLLGSTCSSAQEGTPASVQGDTVAAAADEDLNRMNSSEEHARHMQCTHFTEWIDQSNSQLLRHILHVMLTREPVFGKRYQLNQMGCASHRLVNYTISPMVREDGIVDDDDGGACAGISVGAALDAQGNSDGMTMSAGNSPVASLRSVSVVASEADGSEAGGEGERESDLPQQPGRQNMNIEGVEGVVIVIEDVEEREKLLHKQGRKTRTSNIGNLRLVDILSVEIHAVDLTDEISTNLTRSVHPPSLTTIPTHAQNNLQQQTAP
jgi:hypothetical protein